MVVVLLSGLIPLHTALSQYDQKHETVQAKNGEFYHNSIVCLLSQTTSVETKFTRNYERE